MDINLSTFAIITGICLTLGILQLYQAPANFSWYWIFAAIVILFPIGQWLANRCHQ